MNASYSTSLPPAGTAEGGGIGAGSIDALSLGIAMARLCVPVAHDCRSWLAAGIVAYLKYSCRARKLAILSRAWAIAYAKPAQTLRRNAGKLADALAFLNRYGLRPDRRVENRAQLLKRRQGGFADRFVLVASRDLQAPVTRRCLLPQPAQALGRTTTDGGDRIFKSLRQHGQHFRGHLLDIGRNMHQGPGGGHADDGIGRL